LITDKKNLKKITLQISGMTCAAFVMHNEEALKELPGVKNVVVNPATGKASVEYNPSLVTLIDMIKTVKYNTYE